MTHALKTWGEYFKEVKAGNKNFELRKADRDFKTGDTLLLQEYNPESKQYSGEELKFEITHVLRDFKGIHSGYVIISFKQAVEPV